MPESSGTGAEAGTAATDGGIAVDWEEQRVDAAAREAAACRDVLGGHLARVSCDRTRILLGGRIIAPPKRPAPPRATRRLLDAVAGLLRAHPGLQLLRIEAYSSHDPGGEKLHVRHEIEQSQARADAVFRYLWQKDRISPERLDPVGYGFRPAFRSAGQRWPIVLRVVQRAR